MVEVIQSTRINTDASEDDLKAGEYRDALNISLIASNAGGIFSKGTTFGNIDTDVVFRGLQPDAICLGTAIDSAGRRIIVTFFQFITNTTTQQVLMYLLESPIAGEKTPLIKSSNMNVTPESYLDGYSFVNDLFFFNFRESAPKVINIARCVSTPGFYDNLDETSLTVLKPHPPYAPVAVRDNVGPPAPVANSPIQRKAFQFMMVYRFLDGEQSSKSPASEYLNALDDVATLTALYDHINITLSFPIKDFAIIESVELYTRNSNVITDWRGVKIFTKDQFIKGVANYDLMYKFYDNVVGNFIPADVATKINDAVPQLSNYEAFIENRLFLIDSLLDYDLSNTFSIEIVKDANAHTPDDRVPSPADPVYALTELEWDSEYYVGVSLYDKFGRKYPSSSKDLKFNTDPYIPVTLPVDGGNLPLDDVPLYSAFPALANRLDRPKVTYHYILRAFNGLNYGKPPEFAYWWSFIRSKNTKWEFQHSINCLLRFPYSITKWVGTSDPADFPNNKLFLEDGYLYWDPALVLPTNTARSMVNDYIDIIVPSNFPYPLDNTILVDFMLQVATDANAQKTTILNREVVEIFANKIRIRGDRAARWFSDAVGGRGQYHGFPKFTTGINLTGVGTPAPGGLYLLRDETTFPLVIKRPRQNNLESLIMYDTPQVYPVTNPGTKQATFQSTQAAVVARVDYPSIIGAPLPNGVLAQGTILVQPIQITPATTATNHAIKVTWGPNAGDSLRLRIKVSIWLLDNASKQPISEVFSATEDANGEYLVGNGTTVEYLINLDAELPAGWYGYGIEILSDTPPRIQFENPDFDEYLIIGDLAGWRQSIEGDPDLFWLRGSVEDNFAYVNVSAMWDGFVTSFSKTIYQFLEDAPEDQLLIEVVIEGVGIKGPDTGSAVTQYPSNTNLPPVSNDTELLIDSGSNIVPYFIDCDTPEREVTMVSLNYEVSAGGAPANCLVRAELWRLNQTTKQPISRIGGSEGAWTAVPTIAGPASVPFGISNVINETGWYGIALVFDGPVPVSIADFTNKNYDSEAAFWVVTDERTPTWVFQADTLSPPVYSTDYIPNPLVVGADLGDGPMTAFQLIQPIFFPATVFDPTGFDTHQIRIDWGDNFQNGWEGGLVDIAIWEVDQITKKPISYIPIMTAEIAPKSFIFTHLISNAGNLLGNKWYGFGLRNPHGHPFATLFQFNNTNFFENATGWAITPGATATWVRQEYKMMRAQSAGVSIFDSGFIGQSLNGYVQVVLPNVQLGGAFDTDLFIEIKLDSTIKQIINLGINPPQILNIVFEPIRAFNGAVSIRFYTTAVTGGPVSVNVGIILNAFNPYVYSTPKLRKYAVSDVNYESWADYAQGVLDEKIGALFTYWKITQHGATFQTAALIGGKGFKYEYTVDSGGNVPLLLQVPNGGGTTALAYGRINMTDAALTAFLLNSSYTAYISGSGAELRLQAWVFNDPNAFVATGVMINEAVIVFSYLNYGSVNLPVNIPAGYKYFGLRLVGNAGVNETSFVQINNWVYTPQAAYDTWYKEGNTLGVQAYERQKIADGTTTIANFHVDNLPVGATSGRLGQDNLIGVSVRATIELFVGAVANDYDLILTDSSGFELGRANVLGALLGVGNALVITVGVVNPPSTTGLFLSIKNNSGVPISARARQITNVPINVFIEADNTIANAKTWQVDSSNNMVQLATTSKTSVDATQNIPGPAEEITVVLADAGGTEISAQQTFDPADGVVTLIFDPTSQPSNFTYGVKVKNNVNNNQIAGTIRIRSIRNIKSNLSSATILRYNLGTNAWVQVQLGAFVLAGYASGFIAVADNITVGAFTPVVVTPTSYHLVADIFSAAVENHSNITNAGLTPYNYGPVYPFAGSFPDAYGVTYLGYVGQSIGDINLRIVDLGEKSRSNIVRWSDPIIIGTRTNNTNAFVDGNQYAVDFQRGAIQVMFAMHDHTLFCIHEQGMSSLYVQRSVVTAVDTQSEQLFLTSKVIGNDNKLTSNLGTVNPESCRVVESGTVAYGFDLIRKSLWQKTNNGVRNLTYECNAKALFNKICYYRLKAFNDGEDVKIYSGYNEKTKTFYLTFAPFMYKGQLRPAITVAWCAYIDGFLSRYSFEPMSYLATEDVIHTIRPRELTNPDFFGDFSFWQQTPYIVGSIAWAQSPVLGGTIQAVSAPTFNTQLIYQAIPLAQEVVRVRFSILPRAAAIHIRVYSFNDPINPLGGTVLVDQGIAAGDTFNFSANIQNNTPTKYVGFYITSDNGSVLVDYFNVNGVPSIWAHDQDGRTNNFFGVQYDSMIHLVLNVQQGQVRIFNNIGVMSESVWSVEAIITSEGQLSALGKDNFRLRDGIYSAAIMRDMLTPQDALPDPVNNIPIVHGNKMAGVWIRMILRNDETLRQIELRAVYLGSDELSGNLLNKK